MANLGDLAPELLILILSATSDPRDLHALISASSSCFRAFELARSAIFLSVLKNALTPDAFREAIALCHVPVSFPPGDPLLVLEPFLEKYFATPAAAAAGGGFEPPSDPVRLSFVCRLYNVVSAFTDRYFAQTSKLLYASEGRPAAEKPPPLAAEEKARIQRAFFRHEVYARVFPKVGRASVVSGEEQFRLFVNRMTPYEVEELSCIHSYLAGLAAGCHRELEHRLVSAVLSCRGVRVPTRRSPSPPAGGVRNAGRGNGFFAPAGTRLRRRSISPSLRPRRSRGREEEEDDLEEEEDEYVSFGADILGLYLFGDAMKRRMPALFSSLASFGLGFTSRLVHGDANERKNLLQGNVSGGRDFLPEALRHSPGVGEGLLDDNDNDDGAGAEHGGPEGAPRPTEGYLLYRRPGREVYHQLYDGMEDLRYNPLREMGYVFWSAERIGSQVARGNLERAVQMTDEAIESRGWRVRRSAQERLWGVTLPMSERTRIVEEFSYHPGD